MAQMTQEELQEFQSYRQTSNALAAQLGELHFQRTLIDLELDRIKSSVADNVTAQQNQLKVLGEKYGDGSINVTTGEITPTTQA